jgi:hypothetical protein
MAFDPDSLCVLSYARGRRQPRGFTHWYYWSEDLAELQRPGYFDPAADLMRAGDIVFAAGSKGAVQLAVAFVRMGEKVPGQVYRQGGEVVMAEMCRDDAQGCYSPRTPDAAA